MSALTATPAATTVIRPGRPPAREVVRDLWRYRELWWALVSRELRLRYRQTLLGAAWAVLQPLLSAAALTFVFARVARLPAGDLPYPVFAYVGALVWFAFANALARATTVMVDQQALVRKIWFPRLILPLAAVGGVAVDLVVGLAPLGGLLAWYRVAPAATWLWLPLWLLLALLVAAAAGIGLAALHARYRDVKYTVTFLLQIGMFAAPVAYAATLVPARWRGLYALNPLCGAIEGARAALAGSSPWSATGGGTAWCVAAAVAIASLWYFERVERTLADVV